MEKISLVVAEQHPLMLKGIVSFLSNYPSLYTIESSFNNIQTAIEYCVKNKVDILILGEFKCDVSTTELIQWICDKKIKTKIICYVERKPYVSAEQLIKIGTKGVVWKTSHPSKLNRAIDSVKNNCNYIDDGLIEIQPAVRKITSCNILTVREKQILQLIADGQTNKHIAKLLNVSNKTVETHRLNMMKKMDVHSGIELLKVGLRMGVCTI